MNVVTTVADMVAARGRLPRPLGLVPTMGYLHEGHMTLARRARADNRSVVATIFVNPTQFGPNEDLATYPRALGRDLQMLEEQGVDVVFTPPTDEVYPPGYSTYVNVEGIAKKLEGTRRPGHFRGVATVVTKLFTIIRPDRAYFGQKDGQQAVVIRRLNADLNLGVEIVVVPTVREADGLAMSSRNVYLTPQERAVAPVLYRSLCKVQEMWRDGVRDAEVLGRTVREMVGAAEEGKLEYISIADALTLEELDVVDRPAMASLAARFGRARLIDNIMLDSVE